MKNNRNKPKTALEEFERAIAIANTQPSTSTVHTEPSFQPNKSAIQGLKLLNAQGDGHVVCHNVSAETLCLPSDDTNTAMNSAESSHVPNHVGFDQESVPVPQQVVPQPIASGPPPSSSNERNMESHDNQPKGNNESINQNEESVRSWQSQHWCN